MPGPRAGRETSGAHRSTCSQQVTLPPALGQPSALWPMVRAKGCPGTLQPQAGLTRRPALPALPHGDPRWPTCPVSTPRRPQADSPEEAQWVWLRLSPEEDVHRGLETLQEHELPALPCRGQADTLDTAERTASYCPLQGAHRRLDPSSEGAGRTPTPRVRAGHPCRAALCLPCPGVPGPQSPFCSRCISTRLSFS